MEIEATPRGDAVNVVRLTGRLDSAAVDRVETRFNAVAVASGRHAAVDLSGVNFLASMAVRMFITAARAMNNKGRKIALFGASAPVGEVLDAMALDRIVPIVADEEQALAVLEA